MQSTSIRRGRRLAATAVGVLVVAMVTPGVAVASQHEGTVSATVTASDPAEACLTVSTTSLAYGSVEFGTVSSRTPSYTVTSCSTADEGVLVRGTDAADVDTTVAWALDSSVTDPCTTDPVTLNTYKHDLRVEDPNSAGTFSQILLSTTNTGMPFAGHVSDTPTSIAPGDSRTVDNRIFMPCPDSDGAGVQMTMSIIFTALLS